VKLTHPRSGQVIDVDQDHAGIYRSQGWVDEPAASAPKASRPRSPRARRAAGQVEPPADAGTE
jgi:hypothetical protein